MFEILWVLELLTGTPLLNLEAHKLCTQLLLNVATLVFHLAPERALPGPSTPGHRGDRPRRSAERAQRQRLATPDSRDRPLLVSTTIIDQSWL